MDEFSTVGVLPARGAAAPQEGADGQASGGQGLRDAARRLIEYNWGADPGIRASYLFPSGREIRLIHLDDNSPETRAEDGITPFYFGASDAEDIPFPSAIALIRPDEKERLSPPEGWGDWTQAESFPRKAA